MAQSVGRSVGRWLRGQDLRQRSTYVFFSVVVVACLCVCVKQHMGDIIRFNFVFIHFTWRVSALCAPHEWVIAH